MHNLQSFLDVMVILITVLSSLSSAQQSYAGNAFLADCSHSDALGPSPTFLYACNGKRRSCPSFLIYKSQPPFDSVPTISTLMSSDVDDLASANNATRLTVFPTNKEVIVPVNCSCSGWHYEAMTTYPMEYVDYANDNASYLGVANDTFQGLSTCDSLMRFNGNGGAGSVHGGELRVPLRCACPTSNQTRKGVRYLLTYSINWNDTVNQIGNRFHVRIEDIFEANGFSDQNPTIYPFTTILIPLATPPSSSETIIQQQQPVAAISAPTEQKSQKKLHWGAGISAIFGVISLIGILSACFLCRKKMKGVILPLPGGKKRKLFSPADLRVEIASLEDVLRQFKYEDIIKATQNFSSRNKIGGSVYRGVFGRELLAVKRVVRNVSKEAGILKKLNHFNLIQLKGFCQFESRFYLIFEFMLNGSLKRWLSNDESTRIERWSQRIQIALDVANGLHYLHNFTKPAYVHKDINSDNIMLNGDLRAKITNFGLARATPVEKPGYGSPPISNTPGVRGYVPPECEGDGKGSTVTPEVDVYAFGVVMMELVSGKGAVFSRDGEEVLLLAEFGDVMKEEIAETEFLRLIDPRLEHVGIEFAMRVVKLSVLCLAQKPEGRPSMGEIVSALVKIQGDLRPLELESFNSSVDAGR